MYENAINAALCFYNNILMSGNQNNHSLVSALRKGLALVLAFFFPHTHSEQHIERLTLSELAEHRTFERPHHKTTTLFRYHDPLIRDMIHMLKYRGNRKAAHLFGTILGEYLLDMFGDEAIWASLHTTLLIPMPLSRKRRAERGFNQTELVLHALKKEFDFVSISQNALRKVRDTPAQTTLSRKERLTNLNNVFRADKTLLYKKRAILFDDVVTTGSTMAAARRALKEAGAKEVICIALAG
jgi:ComF family protein